MIVNYGVFCGERVISVGIVDKLAAGGSIPAFLAGPEAKGNMVNGELSYRAKWWVRHTPGREAMTANGGKRSWICCDRCHGIAIVKHSSLLLAADIVFEDYMVNGFDSIIDSLTQPRTDAPAVS